LLEARFWGLAVSEPVRSEVGELHHVDVSGTKLRQGIAGAPRHAIGLTAGSPNALRIRKIGTRAPYRLLSLDIFDTCLIRDFVCQESMWHAVGNRLVRALPAVENSAEFAYRRSKAEDSARASATAEDTSLAQVYEQLAADYGWSTRERNLALSVEEEVEMAMLQVNPALRGLAERTSGAAVCYLSDTPHRGDFLRRCLDAEGLPSGTVLTSADLGLRKVTGSLFREAAKRFDVKRTELIHIGNDYETDGVGSAIAGVAFGPLTVANPNRYERALDSATTRGAGLLGPCLAGAGRAHRLELPDQQPEGLLSVVTGVAGPFVVAAAAWALLTAEADQLPVLYFAARDGEILLAVARLLQDKLGVGAGVRCRYLHGSRRAWFLPALAVHSGNGFAPALREVLSRSNQATLRGLLSQLDLTGDEQLVKLSDIVSGWSLDAQLGEQRQEVIDLLVEAETFRSLAAERAQDAYKATVEYLRQEHLFEFGRVGLVDIGWRGLAAGSLATVAAEQGTDVRCYFAGGLGGSGSEFAPEGSRAFLVDTRETRASVEPGVVHFLETFCAGTEPSTVGYEISGGRCGPRFDAGGNEPALSWGLAEYQKLIGDYANAVAGLAVKVGWQPDLGELSALRPALLENLLVLWRSPTFDEAERWGDFPYDTGNSLEPVRLGRALTRQEITARVLHPKRRGVDLPWRRGALVRTLGRAGLGNPWELRERLSAPERRLAVLRARRLIRGQRRADVSRVAAVRIESGH